MTTRAERLLTKINEFLPLAAYGAGAVLSGANIVHQVLQSKKRTAEKIQQAGLGGEHRQVKHDLHKLHVQQITHLGGGKTLKSRVQAQKARVKDVEDRGLHKYHQGLAQNPAHHTQVRQSELTTQHPSQ